MYKTASKNMQRRSSGTSSGIPRPDSTTLFRKEKIKAEKAARREAKKGPMRRLKDSWDD